MTGGPAEEAGRGPGSARRILASDPDRTGRVAGLLARLRYGLVGGVGSSFVVALILAPLLVLFRRALRLEGVWSVQPLLDVMGESWFWPSIWQTTTVVMLAVAIAVVIGTALAWVNERTDASFGVLGELLPMLPLFLPPVAMAIGWTFLASPRVGYLNSFVLEPLGIGVNIYTVRGMVFCYSLFLVPFVYLIVASALRSLDSSYEEASRIAGAGRARTLVLVTLPSIKPALANAALLATVTGFALFSIPAILGPNANIDIVTVRLVRSLTQEFPARFDIAVTLAFVLVALLAPLWALARRFGRSVAIARLEGKQTSRTVMSLGVWRWPIRLLGAVYVVVASILPAIALGIVSLQPFWSRTIDWGSVTLRHYDAMLADAGIVRSILNSLRLATIGASLLLVVVALLAIYAQRRSSRWRTMVDGVLRLPAAVSNIVIGVALILTFAGPPFNLHATIWILLIAYLIINMPQASIAAGSAAAVVGGELIDASRVSNASNLRTILHIDLPLMRPGLVAGATMIFVLMAGDLTASSILSSNSNPVIGFTLLEIFETGTYGQLAALAVVVVAIFATVSTVGFVYTRSRLAQQGR